MALFAEFKLWLRMASKPRRTTRSLFHRSTPGVFVCQNAFHFDWGSQSKAKATTCRRNILAVLSAICCRPVTSIGNDCRRTADSWAEVTTHPQYEAVGHLFFLCVSVSVCVCVCVCVCRRDSASMNDLRYCWPVCSLSNQGSRQSALFLKISRQTSKSAPVSSLVAF